MTRIKASEYRAYVEGRGGIPALTPAKGKAARRLAGQPPSKRQGKYNAKGEHRHGLWFASKAQADRWDQLLQLQKLGLIRNLRHEVAFPLVVNGLHICTYRADAVYRVTVSANEYEVIEDTKGFETSDFLLKQKLMRANRTPISVIPAKDIQQWHMKVPNPPDA